MNNIQGDAPQYPDEEGGQGKAETLVARELQAQNVEARPVVTNRAEKAVADVVQLVKEKPYILAIILLSLASLTFFGAFGAGLRFAALRSGGAGQDNDYEPACPARQAENRGFRRRSKRKPAAFG
jgi:hypothetical protein